MKRFLRFLELRRLHRMLAHYDMVMAEEVVRQEQHAHRMACWHAERKLLCARIEAVAKGRRLLYTAPASSPVLAGRTVTMEGKRAQAAGR